MSNRWTRWLGALLAAVMIAWVPATAFAHAPAAHQGPVCPHLQQALQIAPNLAHYPAVQKRSAQCGFPVQAASNPPSCPHLVAAVQVAPRLTDYPGVDGRLRQCLGGVAASSSAPQGVGFNDLSGYGWALADIDILAQMGVFQGVAPHRFEPAGHLTRAQFAALLERIFHLPQPAAPTAFVDVPSTFWAYADIEAAAAYMSQFTTPGGIAFEPSIDVTRIEVAATLGQILVSTGQAQLPATAAAQQVWAGFTDGASVPAGLRQDAAVAVQLGFMKGYPNGRFGVDNSLTRAEAAVLLVRVLDSTETMSGGGGTTTSPTATLAGAVVSVDTGTVPQQMTIDESSPQIATGVVVDVATGATVTVDGSAAQLASVATGDTVEVTEVSGLATIVAATTTTTNVQTASGYLVANPGTVSLTVYAPLTGIQSYGLAAGVGAPSATVGDELTLSLNAAGQVTQIAVGQPSPAPVSGAYDGQGAAGTIDLLVGGGVATETLGPSPTVVIDGQVSSLGSLASGEAVTVDLNVLNGSALVIASS